MSDWPAIYMPNLTTITPFSEESLGEASRLNTGGIGSATAGSQIAMFFPFVLESPMTIVKGFTMNGASVNGNNDVGVYDHEFNLIVSIGATAQSGTNAVQEYDITDTLLNPGRYWMGFVNSGTGTIFALSATDEVHLPGMALLAQTGQTSLPSSATAVKNAAASPIIPLFGFSTTTTI